jgi:hypothetical protein
MQRITIPQIWSIVNCHLLRSKTVPCRQNCHGQVARILQSPKLHLVALALSFSGREHPEFSNHPQTHVNPYNLCATPLRAKTSRRQLRKAIYNGILPRLFSASFNTPSFGHFHGSFVNGRAWLLNPLISNLHRDYRLHPFEKGDVFDVSDVILAIATLVLRWILLKEYFDNE